jgi:hypothetical protein
MFGAMTTPFI